jgi:hypothetical protein
LLHPLVHAERVQVVQQEQALNQRIAGQISE